MNDCDCKNCAALVKATRLEADAYELDSLETIYVEQVEPAQPRIFMNVRGGYGDSAQMNRTEARRLRNHVGMCLNRDQATLSTTQMWNALAGKESN